MTAQTTCLKAIQGQKAKEVKAAFKAAEGEELDLDLLFIEAAKTFKKPSLAAVYDAGEVSQDALNEGLAIMAQGGKDTLFLIYVEHLEDLEWQDASGRTLLSRASDTGKPKIVSALLERGVDPKTPDNSGLSALYYALAANKAKWAKELMALGYDIQGEAGRKMIEVTTTKTIKADLIQAYIDQRKSTLSKEEFVAKWGELKKEDDTLQWPEDPLGDRIMKGSMYTVGYFPSGEDPTTKDLDWEAIDAAKSLANKLAKILRDQDCQGFDSEGGMIFAPFFIPSLGRSPGTAHFDAKISQDALDASSGAYSKYIQSYRIGQNEGFEPSDLNERLEDGGISQEQFVAYKHFNEVIQHNLNNVKKYMLYTDFVEFPVIIGGLDRHYNFVGVFATAVWT